MARSEKTFESKMKGDLRRLMDHAGLGGVPIEALGGNHPWSGDEGPPEAVRKTRYELPLGFWMMDHVTEEKTDLRNPEMTDKTPVLSQLPKMEPTPIKRRQKPPPIPKPEPGGLHPRTPKAKAQTEHEVLYGKFAPEPPGEDNPVELAIRIQKMIWEKKLNVTEAARELGRSRAYVRNHLRLLRMPNVITEHVRTGRLTEGHARVIGKMRDPEAIARLVIRRQLSVRQTELIARRLRYIGPDGLLLSETAVPNAKYTEDLIEDALGMKVRVKDRGGRGKIEIHYNSPRENNELVTGLCKVFAGLHPDDY